MNKERAREILKGFKKVIKINNEFFEALDIAIESLEHEEKCNKAINDSAKAIAEMERLCAKCQVDNELRVKNK